MATSSTEYRQLEDNHIDNIVNIISSFNYTEKQIETEIIPNITQWLYDNYVSLESTCVIISQICNINRVQTKITEIYEGIIPPLPAKTNLDEFLNEKEYLKLEQVMEPREHQKSLTGTIDQEQSIKINFKTKKVTYIKKTKGKTPNKITPVIEAVPQKLIVYDSPLLDQPRTFKIVWSSHVSQRPFTTSGDGTGATISEIEQYLINAGFSHSPRMVSGTLSCMINTMINEGYAEIKTDIDNTGVYYNVNTDKITCVDLDFTKPSISEMKEAIKILNDLSNFYKDNSKTFSTVLKWSLMSVFSYAKKQAGKWMEWLYLKGSAGSGKTTLANIMLYLYDVPTSENNIGGSSFDTVARLGAKISKSCLPLVVNEPASVFNRHSTNEMVKVCVESTTARSKYKGSYFGSIPAFSPVIFTANQYLPEDDALIRRLYVLSFSYSQRKTDFEKAEFESAFHITTPKFSPLKKLNVFGRFAIRYIMDNPSLLLDDWKDVADKIIECFYYELDEEVPEYLKEWAESESLDDLDDTQREDIRSFFVNEFNNARKRITIQDEIGFVKDTAQFIEGASTMKDFRSVNWGIVNNRMFTWAIPHVSRSKQTQYICITQGVRKNISERLDYCSDLKSLGELIGWEYKGVRINGKVMKVLKVPFDDFMSFLYPNIELESDE